MRFATVIHEGREQAAVKVHGDAWTPLTELHDELAGDLLVLISARWSTERLWQLRETAEQLSSARLISGSAAQFAPPYRHPKKIWGIGLNYGRHARDLDEHVPSEPASFIKGEHTIIGPGDAIELPAESQRVTAEAELGLILSPGAGTGTLPDVFGVSPVLDQTAEDILQRNPRFLTRSKNFTTFFSFGPEVVTLDEIEECGPLADIRVSTVVDGEVMASDVVANMTFLPHELLAFHSWLTFVAGDILSPGTPGASRLEDGSVATARIDHLMPLTNPVRRTS
jgi:2-keto-4-pentenoate hydratase/2-oxohepta-3-ene-1,7-dioic acid hydratase in catechol pathway